MKPVIIAKGQSTPVVKLDSHAVARITEPVVRLPGDREVMAKARAKLDPRERRHFDALFADARRDPGCGIRPAARIALAKMRAEVTERICVAEKIVSAIRSAGA